MTFVFPKDTTGALLESTKQNARLMDEIESLRQQFETERMRLVACGVVALANTPESAKQAREMPQDYWSASLNDVIRAVDAEMELHKQLSTINAAYEKSVEQHNKTLDELATVEKERNSFQDQCIRLKHERVLEKEQLAAALAACEVKNVALQEVAGLISESSGVYGLHLNGDESPWEEVEMGGRFERLTTLPEALAIQPDASALKQHDEALIDQCAEAATHAMNSKGPYAFHIENAIRELKKEV